MTRMTREEYLKYDNDHLRDLIYEHKLTIPSDKRKRKNYLATLMRFKFERAYVVAFMKDEERIKKLRMKRAARRKGKKPEETGAAAKREDEEDAEDDEDNSQSNAEDEDVEEDADEVAEEDDVETVGITQDEPNLPDHTAPSATTQHEANGPTQPPLDEDTPYLTQRFPAPQPDATSIAHSVLPRGSSTLASTSTSSFAAQTLNPDPKPPIPFTVPSAATYSLKPFNPSDPNANPLLSSTLIADLQAKRSECATARNGIFGESEDCDRLHEELIALQDEARRINLEEYYALVWPVGTKPAWIA